MNPYAFLSYQTADRLAARQLKDLLDKIGIASFLAHEDIGVSEEWRLRILEEIGKADLFICLLSKNYFESHWCVQESGIAAFRQGISIIPLSLDGTNPRGFISNYQSVKVNPDRITPSDIITGILKYNKTVGVNLLLDRIARSSSYRDADANFESVLPYISEMSEEQIKMLLERSAENNQIYAAARCAREYLPPLLKSYGHLITRKTKSFLMKKCKQYA